MFNQNKKVHNHSDEYVEDLLSAATEAVQGYEEYLLDKIDHNKLAKVMKRLYNLLPPPDKEYPKAKKIENRDPKDFFSE